MTMDSPILVWLRRDLRHDDHPALFAACAQGRAVPVYVHDPDQPWPLEGASLWWLHRSLACLRPLILQGETVPQMVRLAQRIKAKAVFWNRDWRPGEPAREARLAQALADHGIEGQSFAADLLFEPGQILTGQGRPFQVFTPFWRAVMNGPPPHAPLPAPCPPPTTGLGGLDLAELNLLPSIPWWRQMDEFWQPGEQNALNRLDHFLDHAVADYAPCRDLPAQDATSRLSPHLAFGEISPRRIWHMVRSRPPSQGADTFLKELGWREFSQLLLHAEPQMRHLPLRTPFQNFPWDSDHHAFDLWKKGMTGYPIVDAGMRQLWQLGWMHNRVRMITASFLVKDLLLPWNWGEAWFRHTLADYDPANNVASWQWVAGCGADAAPYFRIFNPVLQGQKFDPDGSYVRRFVPELADLPAALIHTPWKAGRRLAYPAPMIDHGWARDRALAALQSLKE